MAEEQRPEGEMIEIGDLTDESIAAQVEPPTRVVIEYRDRGIPWMLLPPLLILSAVVAVVAVPKLKKEPERIAVRATAAPGDISSPIQPAPTPTLDVVAPRADPVANLGSKPPADPPAPPAVAPVPVEAPAVEEVPAPASVPRIQGLGFDLEALKRDARDEATIDPSITVAGEQPPAPTTTIDPLPRMGEDGDKQPVEVDADVLPPDPRIARQQRLQRASEVRKKVEADRGKFHADLAEIVRRQGDRGAGSILQLCQEYGVEVDPEARRRVTKLLGEYGIYVGASRPVRINLMRAEGFPETAILNDIFDVDTRHFVDKTKADKGFSKAVRGGPRSIEEAYCAAARTLLNYPPRRTARDAPSSSNTSTQPASSPTTRSFGSYVPPR